MGLHHLHEFLSRNEFVIRRISVSALLLCLELRRPLEFEVTQHAQPPLRLFLMTTRCERIVTI